MALFSCSASKTIEVNGSDHIQSPSSPIFSTGFIQFTPAVFSIGSIFPLSGFTRQAFKTLLVSASVFGSMTAIICSSNPASV
jgi:hypothetical protein